MITDLFSHKIHSSGNEWPDKLAELASIFSEFDGQLFDREAFESRLQQISPRVSYITSTGRDVSKFRDEISAYPAYLGLYFLEQSDRGWLVRVSQTAKKFLVREEPDVGSFLRLQLPLFQYPNAMGAAYQSFTNSLRIQANTRDRTIEFINEGIHLSPVRLIAVALKADAALSGNSLLKASITFDEVFGLANSSSINKYALPPLDKTMERLQEIRNGNVHIPEKYESRFHILKHTELFNLENSTIRLREPESSLDADQITQQIEAIARIDVQFSDFDSSTNAEDIERIIASGKWGNYFDGVKILPSEIVEILSNDIALTAAESETVTIEKPSHEAHPIAEIYPFRERANTPPVVQAYNRKKEFADPEITRIKRQRRNLAHKEMVNIMDLWLRQLGALPKENDHIDLYAKIPNDGSFIFEMKSGGENLFQQIRKGLSQLYEYRYRYRSMIADDVISLCLVLPHNPTSIPWIIDYLCNDRQINVCWFDENGNLTWPVECADSMKLLNPSS
jgi:hypothetical protein